MNRRSFRKIGILPVVSLLFLVGRTDAQVVSRTASGIKTVIKAVSVEIDFYSPSIVRVIKSPMGKMDRGESLSVIMKPRPVSFTMRGMDEGIVLQSDSLRVMLDTITGRVSFSTVSGVALLTEKDNGIRFVPRDSSYVVRQAWVLDKDEPVYGLGQQQDGQLNQRGQRIRLAQDNRKISIPFFQSLKGYGLFWDNYSPTLFSDSKDETVFESEVGQRADYYFLYGGNADGVVGRMRTLTGEAPLMPLWVFGYLQSRERYKSQFELVDVVRRYRSLRVPSTGSSRTGATGAGIAPGMRCSSIRRPIRDRRRWRTAYMRIIAICSSSHGRVLGL